LHKVCPTSEALNKSITIRRLALAWVIQGTGEAWLQIYEVAPVVCVNYFTEENRIAS